MAHIIDWDNGRVFELVDDSDLALEAFAYLQIVEQFPIEDLEGGFPFKERIIGAVNGSHSPMA
jgi:hypothetical protein